MTNEYFDERLATAESQLAIVTFALENLLAKLRMNGISIDSELRLAREGFEQEFAKAINENDFTRSIKISPSITALGNLIADK